MGDEPGTDAGWRTSASPATPSPPTTRTGCATSWTRHPRSAPPLAHFAAPVRAGGGCPVADVGCGPGRITAHLRGLGVGAFGVDLSPGTIDVARRDHPGARFEVGSMTDPDLADGSLAGLVARYSLIHVPTTGSARSSRTSGASCGPLLLGFHAGDGSRLRTEGYGGHPMKVHVHRRRPGRMAARPAPPGPPSGHTGPSPRPRAPSGPSSSRAAPADGPRSGSARPTAGGPRGRAGRAPHGAVTRRYGPGPPGRV